MIERTWTHMWSHLPRRTAPRYAAENVRVDLPDIGRSVRFLWQVGADCIEIESRREGETLCIEVRNHNSTLQENSNAGGHGIGFSNTRLRLKELYGDDADIRLDMLYPQGVACRIRLPFRELEAEEAPEHVAA